MRRAFHVCAWLLAALSFVLVGCGGGQDATTQGNLQGTWTATAGRAVDDRYDFQFQQTLQGDVTGTARVITVDNRVFLGNVTGTVTAARIDFSVDFGAEFGTVNFQGNQNGPNEVVGTYNRVVNGEQVEQGQTMTLTRVALGTAEIGGQWGGTFRLMPEDDPTAISATFAQTGTQLNVTNLMLTGQATTATEGSIFGRRATWKTTGALGDLVWIGDLQDDNNTITGRITGTGANGAVDGSFTINLGTPVPNIQGAWTGTVGSGGAGSRAEGDIYDFEFRQMDAQLTGTARVITTAGMIHTADLTGTVTNDGVTLNANFGDNWGSIVYNGTFQQNGRINGTFTRTMNNVAVEENATLNLVQGPATADVSGSWSGTYTTDGTGASGTWTANFTQDRNQLMGEVTVNGQAATLVTATIIGDRIAFGTAQDLTGNVAWNGVITTTDGTMTITGRWAASTGAEAIGGTFTGTRINDTGQ
jgi:hypothetical protein